MPFRRMDRLCTCFRVSNRRWVIKIMATDRAYLCSRDDCAHRRWAPSLFAALKDVAHRQEVACPLCGAPSSLELTFPFALGAGTRTCRVVAAFLPEKIVDWQDGDATVQFYPFLAVTESNNKDQSFWLPYWHVTTREGRSTNKYGQWAPYIDSSLFASMVSQARAEGYAL